MDPSEGVTRRRLARSLALFVGGAPVATLLYAWRIEPHWLELVRRDLPIEGLPGELAGRTLLQITDLHIGDRVDDGYLIDSLRRAAGTEPDLVVVTGDTFMMTGSMQSHTIGTDPTSPLNMGSIWSLMYSGSLSDPNPAPGLDRVLTNPGEVGVMAMGNESISLPDNVGISITNFEVVPGPGAVTLLALAGLFGSSRRRR